MKVKEINKLCYKLQNNEIYKINAYRINLDIPDKPKIEYIEELEDNQEVSIDGIEFIMDDKKKTSIKIEGISLGIL